MTFVSSVKKALREAEKQLKQAREQGDIDTIRWIQPQIQDLKLQLIILGGDQ